GPDREAADVLRRAQRAAPNGHHRSADASRRTAHQAAERRGRTAADIQSEVREAADPPRRGDSQAGRLGHRLRDPLQSVGDVVRYVLLQPAAEAEAWP